jgi:hypothetical protein
MCNNLIIVSFPTNITAAYAYKTARYETASLHFLHHLINCALGHVPAICGLGVPHNRAGMAHTWDERQASTLRGRAYCWAPNENCTTSARATRAHRMRPLQRTYFMMDVREDTTREQNVIRPCLFAMEPEERVRFVCLVCEYLEGMKDREWWVHPINAARLRDGHFCTLYTPLREDPAKFLIT